jgi:beta-galactosidase
VEDQGRVNYGALLGEQKGLVGPATLHGDALEDWEVAPLLLEQILALNDQVVGSPRVDASVPLGGPGFAYGAFDLPGESPTSGGWLADRYLQTVGLGKGVAWVNGFCLGRYWSRGPQHTLYIPGPVLMPSGNSLTVFEQQAASRVVRLVGLSDLGHTEF